MTSNQLPVPSKTIRPTASFYFNLEWLGGVLTWNVFRRGFHLEDSIYTYMCAASTLQRLSKNGAVSFRTMEESITSHYWSQHFSFFQQNAFE
jgi:hypothetical protein